MSARVLFMPEPTGAPETPLSDEALVAACAVRDEEALRTLFRRHEASVARFLSRVVGPHSSDVDDLVQCTFLSAWDGARRFRAQGSVRAWLWGIAANHARQHLKKRKRRAALSEKFASPVPVPSPTGEDYARHREALDRLSRALEDLPAPFKLAFVLCDIEDLPGTEAARVLKVRPGTLWRRLHEARRRLRAAIKEGDA